MQETGRSQAASPGDETGGPHLVSRRPGCLVHVSLIQDRRGIDSLPRGEQPAFSVIRHLPLYRAAGRLDPAGETCETFTEGTVMLDGGAQFLGARVLAVPGGQQ